MIRVVDKQGERVGTRVDRARTVREPRARPPIRTRAPRYLFMDDRRRSPSLLCRIHRAHVGVYARDGRLCPAARCRRVPTQGRRHGAPRRHSRGPRKQPHQRCCALARAGFGRYATRWRFVGAYVQRFGLRQARRDERFAGFSPATARVPIRGHGASRLAVAPTKALAVCSSRGMPPYPAPARGCVHPASETTVSTRSDSPSREHEAPRYEPWLGVASASLVPSILLFVLPPVFVVPMMASAGALLAAGIVMLVRHEGRSRRGETA
jgi:hypothetical protein